MSYKLFFGRPDFTDYNEILDMFSNSKLNSIKTSTVPHVQYWKNTQKAVNVIEKNLDLILNNSELFFEYSTPSFGSNKSSMTDLMIIAQNCKIAIEAKYTEYVKGKYQTISEWYSDGKNKENRLNVLEYWKSLISNFSDCEDLGITSSLPYQFLHRTASACYRNEGYAAVIYQLFYDRENRDKMT